MNRVDIIRSEEKKYHDFCYENYNLFEPGTWLHRPVRTVLDLLEEFKDNASFSVLDLGSGIGRNSIPIAESMKNRNGKVVCVDLLHTAIEKLHYYSEQRGLQDIMEIRLSDIENFTINQAEYDLIIAVSALEHVSSEEALVKKLNEMVLGIKINGANCIIIGSNIREVTLETNMELDPMFEVNLSTERMLELLDSQYFGWEIQKRFIKELQYDIQREGQTVKLTTDCITFVAKNSL